MGTPADVSEQNFEAQVIRSTVPVLVDFWAEWCAPCRMLAPILEDLASQYDGRLKVVKVDVDRDTALAQRYRIASIPALAVFKDGQLIECLVGYMPKPALKRRIDAVLAATLR